MKQLRHKQAIKDTISQDSKNIGVGPPKTKYFRKKLSVLFGLYIKPLVYRTSETEALPFFFILDPAP